MFSKFKQSSTWKIIKTFLPSSLYEAYNYIYIKAYDMFLAPVLIIVAQIWIVFMIAMSCEDFHQTVDKAIQNLEEKKIDSIKHMVIA